MRRKVALFVLSGCSIELLERTSVSIAEMFKEEGASADWAWTVFPSTPYASSASLITGLYPQSHGCVVQKYFDSRRSVERLLTCNSLLRNSILRIVENAGGKTAIVEGPEGLLKGGTVNVRLFSPELGDFAYYSKVVIRRHDPDVLILKIPLIRETCYEHGPRSEHVREALKSVDDFLMEVFELLERKWRNCSKLYILISDHGVTVAELNEYERIAGLSSKDLNFHVVSQGRLLQIYLKDSRSKLRAVSALANLEGVDLVFEELELKSLKSFSPDIGDLVISLEEGFYALRDDVIKGCSGGFTDNEMKVPLMIYGDGVRQGSIIFAELVDVAATIAYYLTIRKAFDGRPIVEAFDGLSPEAYDKTAELTSLMRYTYRELRKTLKSVMELKRSFAEGALSQPEYYLKRRDLRLRLRALSYKLKELKSDILLSLSRYKGHTIY
ncbi:MAG: hypothetical protein DRJ51_04670 [Thermoprotei archaeon]|nr:MAG: hypothetical protein DRJ51_04670 [Thermoprotei archaeon]RLF02266.1 MAG: hypothetical protein DRJ59_04045 [Thermoprotei archaeon]